MTDMFYRRAMYAAFMAAAMMSVLTAFISWWTFRPMVDAVKSIHTETTQGAITKLKVVKLPPTQQLALTQGVELEYTYQIDGQEFISTRYQPNDNGPVSGLVLPELLKNYHRGSTVTVYYNSANPADAVLKPPQSKPKSLDLLIWFGLMTAAIWVTAIALKRYPPEEK